MSTPRFATITAEALASLRARIGEAAPRPEPYIEVATRDAIRHWAHGIGDRNPFWLERGVAPPTILFAMDRVVSGYVGGLPGIHAMYAGADFRWRRPIREGERVVGESTLQDLIEKPSAFARRAIQQIYRTTFKSDGGGVVCVADSWCFRTERGTAREAAPGPLEGITGVELGGFVSAAYAARCLADLGARVIEVEPQSPSRRAGGREALAARDHRALSGRGRRGSPGAGPQSAGAPGPPSPRGGPLRRASYSLPGAGSFGMIAL